jgi:hypothetical protein
MTLLYKNLSEGFDKDEAMRRAKINFIKNYSPNPYFWSAFILSGNTDKIELKSNREFPIYLVGIPAILLFILVIFVKRKMKK